MRNLDPILYEKICRAHEAISEAYNYAYKVPTPFRVRAGLGRAQSVLIHYVIKQYEKSK